VEGRCSSRGAVRIESLRESMFVNGPSDYLELTEILF